MTTTTRSAGHIFEAATITVEGRDYRVFRVGGCQVDIRAGGEQCTGCGIGHWWNVWGIAPQRTAAELALPAHQKRHIPYAYASPIRAHGTSLGAIVAHGRDLEVPPTDGWMVRDEMNRVTFGYATSFEEMVTITARALQLPAV